MPPAAAVGPAAANAAAAAVSSDEWAVPVSEACKHCGQEDYGIGFGPRTLLQCSCCQGSFAHVECEEKAIGRSLSEESLACNNEWFCSEVHL